MKRTGILNQHKGFYSDILREMNTKLYKSFKNIIHGNGDFINLFPKLSI